MLSIIWFSYYYDFLSSIGNIENYPETASISNISLSISLLGKPVLLSKPDHSQLNIRVSLTIALVRNGVFSIFSF